MKEIFSMGAIVCRGCVDLKTRKSNWLINVCLLVIVSFWFRIFLGPSQLDSNISELSTS